jgi:two-component system, NarL family, sensor histidine kinase UhpB
MARCHPADRALAVEAFHRACDPAGDGRLRLEQRIVRPDGEVRWIAVQGQVLFQTGVPERLVGFWADITERKHAEERLRATNEQLRTLMASLRSAREEEGTRIAREIHDELGSALTGLRWVLEEVEKTVSEVQDVSLVRALRGKIGAMFGLIDRQKDRF